MLCYDEDKIIFNEFKNKVSKFDTLLKLHPNTILINESGFYCLVIKSRKKISKNFRRWVTSEVLPHAQNGRIWHNMAQYGTIIEFFPLTPLAEFFKAIFFILAENRIKCYIIYYY